MDNYACRLINPITADCNFKRIATFSDSCFPFNLFFCRPHDQLVTFIRILIYLY